MLYIFLQTGEGRFPAQEVKVAQLGNDDFRIEVDGVSLNISLGIYSEVKFICQHLSPFNYILSIYIQYAVKQYLLLFSGTLCS